MSKEIILTDLGGGGGGWLPFKWRGTKDQLAPRCRALDAMNKKNPIMVCRGLSTRLGSKTLYTSSLGLETI